MLKRYDTSEKRVPRGIIKLISKEEVKKGEMMIVVQIYEKI